MIQERASFRFVFSNSSVHGNAVALIGYGLSLITLRTSAIFEKRVRGGALETGNTKEMVATNFFTFLTIKNRRDIFPIKH